MPQRPQAAICVCLARFLPFETFRGSLTAVTTADNTVSVNTLAAGSDFHKCSAPGASVNARQSPNGDTRGGSFRRARISS